MKLIRVGDFGQELPGLELSDGKRVNVSKVVKDYDPEFWASGQIERLRTMTKVGGLEKLPFFPDNARSGSPVTRPGKIICVGQNYAEHAREGGDEPPEEPILFMKSPSSLCGPGDDVEIPRTSQKTDWEVELGVVISKKAKYVTEEEALSFVAGYLLACDVSERSFQAERAGQWTKGKSHDTFAPCGPFLLTGDEAPDTNNVNLWLKVNGAVMQKANTSLMMRNVIGLVSYISQFMSLMPGDILLTGTPAGVGAGFKPPRFLKAGDEIELGADRLGEQRHKCIQV